MDATIGRTVIYKLSQQDADQINRRRVQPADIQAAIARGTWCIGAQAHIGNPVGQGDEYPATVVRVWGPKMVNLKVLLDGSDDFWATSRDEGTDNGTWHWPVVK